MKFLTTLLTLSLIVSTSFARDRNSDSEFHTAGCGEDEIFVGMAFVEGENVEFSTERSEWAEFSGAGSEW